MPFRGRLQLLDKADFCSQNDEKARDKGGLSNDIYSEAGGPCDDATITRVMFADHPKIMRHPAAISEADLGECYDRMAHPPTSLAMQS